jgi:hypothetical protein
MPYKDPEKQKAALAAWYQKNKQKQRAKTKSKTDEKRQMLRDIKEKSGCVDCKVMYPYYVLHFDHLPEFKKTAGLAQMVAVANVAQILEEVSKCEVVCSNCHAERSHKRMSMPL